jgi:cytochrome d ubiquinol oxidase subunit II
VLAVAFLAWSQAFSHNRGASIVLAAVTAVVFAGALGMNRVGREGWAFVLSAVTIAGAVATLFTALYPNVMPSSVRDIYSLTIHNASSSHYTLTVMTWVAVIFTPIVLLYQGWSYYVFRRRLSAANIPAETPPATPIGAGGSPRS